MLHILIRTCYRPKAFARAMNSVFGEISEDYELNTIICYDDLRAKEYLPGPALYVGGKYPVEDFWYNLYLNDLLDQVKEPGHILFLDDDDEIISGSLRNLIPALQPETSYIVPFIRNGFQKPTVPQMTLKSLRPGYCGLPNLILWSGHKQYVKFDNSELADYKVLKALQLRWLNIPVVAANARGRGIKEINVDF